jgi:spore germination protein YaaH
LGVSPLEWCEANLRYFSAAGEEARKKIFMGTNWYGRDYSTKSHDPIIGHQFVNVLEKKAPELHWDARTHEHYFEQETDGHNGRVYYPSQLSLNSRMLLAQKYGIGGVAIWEIGQGLEHFIDAL